MANLHTTLRAQAKRALPILKGGLNLLETKGWCQHHAWMTNDGDIARRVKDADKFCAVGAILAAGGRAIRAIHLATSALNANIANGVGVTGYNDTPGRTKRQVIGLFRRTIANVQTISERE